MVNYRFPLHAARGREGKHTFRQRPPPESVLLQLPARVGEPLPAT